MRGTDHLARWGSCPHPRMPGRAVGSLDPRLALTRLAGEGPEASCQPGKMRWATGNAKPPFPHEPVASPCHRPAIDLSTPGQRPGIACHRPVYALSTP